MLGGGHVRSTANTCRTASQSPTASDFLLGGGDCLSSNDLFDEVLATDLTEEASDSVVNFLPAGGGCISS